jgi:DNA polymerase-3 subunit alpha
LYGLGAIKGLSIAAIEPLLEERAKNGAFLDWSDLAKRVNLHSVGKKNLELLIISGAMDVFGFDRRQAMAFLPQVVRASRERFLSEQEGKANLFDAAFGPSDDQETAEPCDTGIGVRFPDKPKKLSFRHIDFKSQKKILGFFLGSHPLDIYERDVATFGQGRLDDIIKGKFSLPPRAGSQEVRLVAYLENRFDRTLKSEKKMRSLRLSCPSGVTEGVLFEEYFPEEPTDLDQPVAVKALIRKRYDSDELQIQIQGIMGLEHYRIRCLKNLCLAIDEGALADPQIAAKLQNLCKSNPGPLAFHLIVISADGSAVWMRQQKYFVSCSDALIEGFLDIHPSCSIDYKALPTPTQRPRPVTSSQPDNQLPS